ncbi:MULTISPECIES: biotin-independent malonate decarboxylase subunit gamma [Cupriavidus]|uniref:Biotin-independent malonate decarboxylase subunit gamma n=1 Tax=Cupriavidus metallidurans TaxID=119219 RepID=A0A482J383_9BURK|nr:MULTISPECIES: biotin-independent malonate decarboxylase subunit gamma [Cupriavidus]MWL91923.1 biotin-independent malonate decarboxylase subunit gamma [Cupriavidus sp. SW-Y-13]QBP14566.1 biotin-independent malonate decarboxylase subunit gamma [Cupriavidus metallidurans]
MSDTQSTSRGEVWIAALSGNAPSLSGYPRSVQVTDIEMGGRPARLIAVVPDADSAFPRARNGEVGLLEGWSLARAVHEAIDADREASVKRAIIAIVDTPSQAYGRREEAFGIHQALAGAAAAYATARLQGHPVIALLVGKAMSGAFLAHGYQANRILALADPGVLVHAMGKEAAARITLRSVEDLEAFAATVPPMAYDIDSYATLGMLWRTIPVQHTATPDAEDLAAVSDALEEALADIDADPHRDLRGRFAGENRGATRRVRAALASQWQG